jgi:hypothetical protein
MKHSDTTTVSLVRALAVATVMVGLWYVWGTLSRPDFWEMLPRQGAELPHLMHSYVDILLCAAVMLPGLLLWCLALPVATRVGREIPAGAPGRWPMLLLRLSVLLVTLRVLPLWIMSLGGPVIFTLVDRGVLTPSGSYLYPFEIRHLEMLVVATVSGSVWAAAPMVGRWLARFWLKGSRRRHELA